MAEKDNLLASLVDNFRYYSQLPYRYTFNTRKEPYVYLRFASRISTALLLWDPEMDDAGALAVFNALWE